MYAQDEGVSTEEHGWIMVNRKNWDTKAIQDARTKMELPAGWEEGASHHKISKERLDWLARVLDGCLRSRDPDLKRAAGAFWDRAQVCIPTEMKAQLKGAPTAKWLWNMPVNLEVGPGIVAENPGQNFDPNTEPYQAKDAPPGARKLTDESALLAKLEAVFLAKLRADPRYPPTVGEWQQMANFLAQAQVAFIAYYKKTDSTGVLAQPRVEQWVPAETGFQRKRQRTFPGSDGRAKFTVNNADSLHADVDATGQQWPLEHTTTCEIIRGDDGIQKHTIYLTMDAAALEHACSRHTYPYFARTDDQSKLVNNFWPTNVVSTASAYLNLIKTVFPGIAQVALESMDAENKLDDRQGRLKAVNAPIGNYVLFLSAKFSEREDEEQSDEQPGDEQSGDEQPVEFPPKAWDVELESVAPDGVSAECYPSDLLKKIMNG